VGEERRARVSIVLYRVVGSGRESVQRIEQCFPSEKEGGGPITKKQGGECGRSRVKDSDASVQCLLERKGAVKIRGGSPSRGHMKKKAGFLGRDWLTQKKERMPTFSKAGKGDCLQEPRGSKRQKQCKKRKKGRGGKGRRKNRKNLLQRERTAETGDDGDHGERKT